MKTLREYRDNYLLSSADGTSIVEQYYNVAPTIVNRINKSEDAGKIYGMIFRDYISPCISMIEAGNKEGCKELYSDMVNNLENEYMR